MKRFLSLLFALCLLASLLTACGGSPASTPAPESEAAPEAPSSVSPSAEENSSSAENAGASGSGESEKEPFVIQSVYDYYIVDSPDPAPSRLLSQYLTEHLSTGEYLTIEPSEQYIPLAPWEEPDPEVSETNYFLFIYAEDIELITGLLDSYDGPRTPIVFREASYSLSDVIKAEEDIRGFMENNRALINAKIEGRGSFVHVRNIMRGYEELKQFADDYPLPELFLIEEPEEKVIDETQIREYS